MTKKELSQLYYLKREIRQQQERLLSLEVSATGCTSSVSGTPGGGGSGDKVGDYAIKIAELRDKIELNKKRCVEEYARLIDFINSVPDSQLRQILTLRYVDCLSWQQVAFKIGGYDEQLPRKKHNSFLKKYEKYEFNLI